MLRHSSQVLSIAILVLVAAGTASAIPYYLTDLGPVGADTLSVAYAVNLVGGAPVTGGFSQDAAGTPNQRKPIIWNSNGSPTNLLPLLPGATAGSGNAVNGIAGNGDVAGTTIVGGNTVAFYLPSGGSAAILPTLGGTGATSVAGVSNTGSVVGNSIASDGNSHTFVWSASGGIIDLGTSGATSTAAGISADGNTVIGNINGFGQACKWTRSGSTWTMSTIVPLSTYNQSESLAVNSSGDVVGACFNYPQGGFPNPDVQAILVKHDGTIVKLGGIGTGWLYSLAYGINDSGVIVGSASTVGPAWVNYTGTADANISLNSLLAPSAAGWNLYTAYGIDNNGNITGKAKNPAGLYHGFLLKPAMLGDANLDAAVDISDLSPVLTNYGKTGMLWADGDFTGDGTVSIDDLSPTLTNYGKSAGASNSGLRPVPEPATLLLAATGLLGLLALARQKRR